MKLSESRSLAVKFRDAMDEFVDQRLVYLWSKITGLPSFLRVKTPVDSASGFSLLATHMTIYVEGDVSDQRAMDDWTSSRTSKFYVNASVCISRAMRWWEMTPKPNIVEIKSVQELVHALSNAGDRLVIVNFYSPGCGGCKALHPELCQLTESNPNALFLKVNYQELKMVYQCLKIPVLPFFRSYRGAEGRLCSFSCTNATIKKFKDALAKHGTERCSLGAVKGLDDYELLMLASSGQI